MKRTGGRVHHYAQCQQCDECWDLFHHPEQREQAMAHGEAQGHTIVIEIASSYHYTPEEKDSGKRNGK